jgi:hypothetical protein
MVVDGRPLKIPKAICMLTIFLGNTMIDIIGTGLSVYVQNQIIHAYPRREQV